MPNFMNWSGEPPGGCFSILSITCFSSWIPTFLAHSKVGAWTASQFLLTSVEPRGFSSGLMVKRDKARIGFLHARMSVMFVKRCNGERPPSLARIRIDLIPVVRDFEGPSLIRRPLQTCHAPNLIGRFPRRLHLHCGGQLVPRKCSRHCAADDRELGGRKPIEGCIDGAETQMSCRLAVISGLCLFTSKRCVLS